MAQNAIFNLFFLGLGWPWVGELDGFIIFTCFPTQQNSGNRKTPCCENIFIKLEGHIEASYRPCPSWNRPTVKVYTLTQTLMLTTAWEISRWRCTEALLWPKPYPRTPANFLGIYTTVTSRAVSRHDLSRQLLRGARVIRTHDVHKTPCVPRFLHTVLGPEYYVNIPPQWLFVGLIDIHSRFPEATTIRLTGFSLE